MGNCGSAVDAIESLFEREIGEAQRKGKDAHEGAVAVTEWAVAAGDFGANAAREADDGFSGGVPNIEEMAVGRPDFFVIPFDETLAEVFEVEFVMKQAVHRTEQEGRVVGPCARRLAVGAEAAHVFDRVELHIGATFEFDWNTESVADDGTPEAAEDTVAF